ncbi:MAG: hypothetical protein HYU36_23980 [Planctomycetes bacterium]|nr:hypothetical protein [Planctomycetota bacterium]
MKNRPLLILFGGRDREGIILRLKSLHYPIRAVVAPERASEKLVQSLARISMEGLRVVRCRKASLVRTLEEFRGDTLLSIGFPYLLPRAALDLFPLCLNVHPTLLPQYRGPTSGPYILMNRETESGSTVHLIDEGMDSGPIVLQAKATLSRFDTIRSLRRKVYSLEPDLVVQALERLKGPGFQPVPQDESRASVYPKARTPADSEIDPRQTLLGLFDFIRACDPDDFPAFFYVEGQKVCIRLWRPDRPQVDGEDTL